MVSFCPSVCLPLLFWGALSVTGGGAQELSSVEKQTVTRVLSAKQTEYGAEKQTVVTEDGIPLGGG